jgi:hypothetical protein
MVSQSDWLPMQIATFAGEGDAEEGVLLAMSYSRRY